MTGNIGSHSSTDQISRSYLNSSISGEDRRAPTNTIDESVWETLSRDLLAVWEKMRLVLWPKHLLGEFLQGETGIEAAERGEGRGFSNVIRSGRWPGTDVVLQQKMSEGLRDWDLWQAQTIPRPYVVAKRYLQGPSHFLFTAKSVAVFDSLERTENNGFFRGICSCMGGGGGCDSPDQTAWWKYVSSIIVGSIGHFDNRHVSSFFQSICIIGYTLFPLMIAALFSAVGLPPIPRIPIYLVLIAWALAAGVSILGGSGVVKGRVGIAVYPLFVFYVGLGCLCFIS